MCARSKMVRITSALVFGFPDSLLVVILSGTRLFQLKFLSVPALSTPQ